MPQTPPEHRQHPVHRRQDNGPVVPRRRHLVPAVRTGQEPGLAPRPVAMPTVPSLFERRFATARRRVFEKKGFAQVVDI